MIRLLLLLFLTFVASCSVKVADHNASGCAYARSFDIIDGDSIPSVVIISPYDGLRDTVRISEPMDNIICMSSSHVACLSAIGADSVITAVSGLNYISDPDLHSGRVCDIGYENSLDYERIVSLNPDLVLTYTVSAAEPPYLSKLRSLDVPVVVLYDHLEQHPLARAEYIRMFGALTGLQEKSDSVFNSIVQKYQRLSRINEGKPVKVLMNIPYGDSWYVPGKENYMSQMIRDAGGEVLGAEEGTAASKVISIEEAWRLSQEADIWLNPGHCSDRSQLSAVHAIFSSFGPLAKRLPIYNNTLRVTPEGGNDFWESGAVRPDLVLEDLIAIFSGNEDASLHYFIPLN